MEELLQVAELAVRRYAESHPRPLQVNKCQAAQMLNLSRPTLDKIIKAGSIKLNRCGLIPISEVDRVLAAERR